jgi:16S rRNA processing protein RimM
LKGAVRVDTILDDERAFEPGRPVLLCRDGRQVEREIEFSRTQHGRRIVKLREVCSIDQTECLVGATLAIPEKQLPKAERGSFYTFDLKGCTVATVDGRRIGIVRDVLEGGTPVLQVEGDREVLIPFAEAFLRRVDLPGRRIVVELPEGLLELNQ